jgi:hypothetical protein
VFDGDKNGSHYFFFFLISNCNFIRRQRKAPLVHTEYTRSNSLTTDPIRNNPQKWKSLLERWFEIYGAVNMWIGVIWGLVGRQVGF